MSEREFEVRVLWDKPLSGTPFRGLILRTPFCYCAYIGVPKDHWLADMQELQFECHWGVTFRGPGDGLVRPADWFWYGWDYGHAGDQIFLPLSLPPELAALLPEGIAEQLEQGKVWTVQEIELDLVNAAVSLSHSMANASQFTQTTLRTAQHQQHREEE